MRTAQFQNTIEGGSITIDNLDLEDPPIQVIKTIASDDDHYFIITADDKERQQFIEGKFDKNQSVIEIEMPDRTTKPLEWDKKLKEQLPPELLKGDKPLIFIISITGLLG